MTSELIKNIGMEFFKEQDRLKGNISLELCSKNYLAYIAGNPPMDFKGHCQFGNMFYSAFPDLNHDFHDIIISDNKVVVRFTLLGTHTGNFMGLPPTNKPIKVTAIAILGLNDNKKVCELHAEFDQQGLMKQLGAIPEPAHN